MKEAAESYQKALADIVKLKELEKEAKKAGINFETSTDNMLINTYFMHGKTYFNMRDFNQAYHYLQQSQAKSKQYRYYEIMYYFGTINFEQGNFAQAEKHFREAVKSPEENQYYCSNAYQNLAVGLSGFFEFIHNVRKRGKALLESLLENLLCTSPKPIGP